jgi:dTDP-4-dehydrorhamnose reductase
MRILLLGESGQLGWELQRTLAPLGDLIAMDYPAFDLAQVDGIRKTLRQAYPQVIVNASAYTAVDRAEAEEDRAMAINAHAPGLLAQEALEMWAALIHFSTDYVFDGCKGSPYTEEDLPNPLGVYGQSKLEGEKAIQAAGGAYLILRTSWVYSMRRDNFVLKVLQWSRQKRTLRLVTDQISNPTWSRMLAEVTTQVLAAGGQNPLPWLRERRGLYHLAGEGFTSRMEWARAILRCDPKREEQVVEEILPAQTSDFPTPARRPLFSALDCQRFTQAFGLRLPPWEHALKLAMETG